jgi:hypothetical protein
MIDMNPALSENAARDLDFHLTFIEDPVFAESFGEDQPVLIVTDLSDNLPEGKVPARISSSDKYLHAPEPPAVAMSLGGFAILGIFMALRRGRRQKAPGRRRRVRTYMRKMA